MLAPVEASSAVLPAPPGAWARLVAVRRTLAWASRGSAAGDDSPYLGANCRRLVGQAMRTEGIPEALAEALAGADSLLASLDRVPQDGRGAALHDLMALLDTIVPASVAGAVLPPFEPRGAIIWPERLTPPAEPARGRPAPVAPVATPEQVPAPPAAETVAAPPPEPEARVEELPLEETAEVEERADRRPEPPPSKPEPPPRRALPLGHPQDTGRPVTALPGLSEDLARALDELDVETIADLLARPPVSHERFPLVSLRDLAVREEAEADQLVAVRGRLQTRCTRLAPGGRRWEVVLTDGTEARLVCRWVTSTPRGWDGWTVGQELGLVGRVEQDDPDWTMVEAEPVGVDGRGSGLLPVYGVGDHLERAVRDLVALALGDVQGYLEDPLPAAILEHHRLLPLDQALREAHFPPNTAGRGRVRLAFEELLLLQLGVAWRAGRDQGERGVAHKILHNAVGHLHAQFGLVLDDGQERVFSDIRRDLLRPAPMARLLQGDVGTGKGRVSLLSAVVVAENGSQVAMVSPDPLAAERSFIYAEPLLRSVGIVPLLVGGRLNHAQADAIRRGEAHIVFGTRRLLGEDVVWRRLGLVVAEERGPHGTVTPASFRGRRPRPDLLVVTRAPIPSSLAFTVFGEFDVSVIPTTERLCATCRTYTATERPEAYARVRERVEQGRQAYVVFPVHDGRDLLGPDDALRLADALKADAFPGRRIAIYCSAMTKDERLRVFEDFQGRRVEILVCTTFIEDAPAVANATELVVEHADMYDLTRLHRLRGHVSHGPTAGHVQFVLSDAPDEAAQQRLDLIIGEHDGFRLAELDLQLRGPEALLGERASDAPEFFWADPPQDRELLLRARAEAFRLVRLDPGLRKTPVLARAVADRWGELLGDKGPVEEVKSPGAARSRRRRRRRRRR